jgi:hypothetical protein
LTADITRRRRTEPQRLRDLPLVDAVEKMTIVDEETRAALFFPSNGKERQIQAEDLHLGDAATAVALDCDPEIRTTVRGVDDELTHAVVVELANRAPNDQDRLVQLALPSLMVLLETAPNPTFSTGGVSEIKSP